MSSTHVPKFGNWEDKDIPYTRYFENARKETLGSFNPNDPEDNPVAFMPRHPVQQQHSGKKRSKTSSQKVDIDSPRISAKIDSYTGKSRSNTSVPHQPHTVSLSSKVLINPVTSSSIDSDEVESVYQKETYTDMVNKIVENKQTGATKFSVVPLNTTSPINRKAKQRTSSKKWCCLFTKHRD